MKSIFVILIAVTAFYGCGHNPHEEETTMPKQSARAADYRIPPGGGPREGVGFAPDDLIQVQRPLVDCFWTDVLGTEYGQSFVSNDSRLHTWEHYVGGRENLLGRVRDVFGVDISADYDRPMHELLAIIRQNTTRWDDPATEEPEVQLVGFENDGGLNSLFQELRLFDDYKRILPIHISRYLRQQFPETMLDVIELKAAADCEVSGHHDNEGTLLQVREVEATLPLRVKIHIEDCGYVLDMRCVVRIGQFHKSPRIDYYMYIDGQAVLE